MGEIKDEVVLTDLKLWIRIEAVCVNVDFMYKHHCPDVGYFSRIGEFNEGGVLEFTSGVIPLRIDGVFLSTLLADFFYKREYTDSRTYDGVMDYYFSFIGIPGKFYDCEMFFNISPQLFYPPKNSHSAMEGIAIYLKPDWDEVEKWVWQLQAVELQAILKDFISETTCLSLEMVISERNRFEQLLEYNQKVLKDWSNSDHIFQYITY